MRYGLAAQIKAQSRADHNEGDSKMKLRLQEWNDVCRALAIANTTLVAEAKTHDRNTTGGKELSDRCFREAFRYEELKTKIEKENLT